MSGLVTVLAGVTFLAANPHGNLVDEKKYAEVLDKHLADARVDYAALQKDRAALAEYLAAVAGVSKADFDAAPKAARAAYLINAYNAYTLESILDAYPIKGGFFGGANSIKGIPGVWNKAKHKTALGEVTLDFIEHETLRKKYDLPGVHMALVCASKGCPPLRAEPYWADALEAQLEDQAAAYLRSPYGLVIDGGKVKVSMIFRWFGGDFDKAGGWKAWVAKRAPPSSRESVQSALEAGSFVWIDYDWSLNDRKGGS